MLSYWVQLDLVKYTLESSPRTSLCIFGPGEDKNPMRPVFLTLEVSHLICSKNKGGLCCC